MTDTGHIHLDAVGGAAGDMFVAALLDALPSLTPRVMADLAAVMPQDAGEPGLVRGESGGMSVQRLMLHRPKGTRPHAHHDHRAGDVSHADGGHASADHGTGFRALVARIAEARLSPGTADHAVAILRRIAVAEARMHGVSLDEVHFHELADWDSLMDVVAAGSIAAALPGHHWSVSDLPLGHGTVFTQHGILPVPAPATTAILEGFRWRNDGVGGERVTPTGAAIIAHLVGDANQQPPAGRLVGSGMGAGTRTLPGMPNILRALVFSAGPAEAGEVVVEIAFDIDDMTGEEVAVAADRLRAAPGVIDLTIGHRLGKKGRTVQDFRVLVAPGSANAVRDLCLRETSTIGLRWHIMQRTCLPRRAEVCSGRRVKRVTRPGGIETGKVESDELADIATLAARRAAAIRGEAGE